MWLCHHARYSFTATDIRRSCFLHSLLGVQQLQKISSCTPKHTQKCQPLKILSQLLSHSPLIVVKSNSPLIDPETKQHLVTCDLCNQVIKLGIRGSIHPISQHRDSVNCKRRAFKESKLDLKSRNLVSQAILIMLCSGSA